MKLRPDIQRRLAHKQRKAKARDKHLNSYRSWVDRKKFKQTLYKGSYFD